MTTVTLADGSQVLWEDNSDFAHSDNASLRLETGRKVLVPKSALLQDVNGYRLPFTAEELARRMPVGTEGAEGSVPITVPIIEEALRVTKETVVTGGVRLTKRVTEREETVDEPLRRSDVQVERVAINQVVTEAPQARQEGDTWIVPILEEVLVVEKRLMLREEVRITRTQTEVHQPQVVTLRTEEAVLEEMTPEVPLAH